MLKFTEPSMYKVWDKNFKALDKADILAKANGLLLGRYIKEPYADGYAFYVI